MIQSVERRKVLIGLLFGAAAGVAAWRQPRESLDLLGSEKLEDIVPTTIGPWRFGGSSGLVIPPEDQLLDALYSQLLVRVYYDGEHPPVMLSIAQSAGQTGILQVHRPEVCYPAGGFRVSPTSEYDVRAGSRVIRTNKLVATAGAIDEQILYWTRVGDRLPMSWSEQRVAVAAQNLRGIIPDAVLVRVSMRSPNEDRAFATLASFVGALVNSIQPDKQDVLLV